MLTLITALFGAAIGALGCYLLIRRRWWAATGWLALGAAGLLNLITAGLHSPNEDAAKWAVTGTLMVIFIVAGFVSRRHARSVRDRPASRSH